MQYKKRVTPPGLFGSGGVSCYIKACKTPEELQALADANCINLADFTDSAEEDVELSLEDLENVGGGKGVAPIALAVIMLLYRRRRAVRLFVYQEHQFRYFVHSSRQQRDDPH